MNASLAPRIAGYPVMAPGGLDYTEEHVYEIEQVSDQDQPKDTIGVLHRVRGDNLVSQLISQGKADFAITVVSPTCAYRNVELGAGTPERVNGGIQLEQNIAIVTDQFRQPLMFQPAVIANSAGEQLKVNPSHGVDPLWIGVKIRLPVAAVVAVQPFLNAKSTVQSILRLKKASPGSLNPGSFEVEAVTEEGFYFQVEVAEDLFNGLRNPVSFEHRDSIYSMALAQGLDILRRDYGNRETWQEYQHLKLLFQMLKQRSLPTWEEDGFKPNQIAATFHPHYLRVDLDEAVQEDWGGSYQ